MSTTTPVVTLHNWGDALFLAVTNAVNMFLQAIPAVIGAIVLIIIGWIVAAAIARLVRMVLARAGADRMFAQHGGHDLYGEASRRWTPSVVVSEVVGWIVRLVFLVAAANALGLTQISALLNQIILWLPQLIVAAVILLVAPLLARFVRGVITAGAGDMGFSNSGLLGQLAYWAVMAFAVIIAVNQIGIAQNLIDILFVGIVFAIALAFGLAFGLGGRDVAAQVTRDWYSSTQSAAQQVQEQTATQRRPQPMRRAPGYGGAGRK